MKTFNPADLALLDTNVLVYADIEVLDPLAVEIAEPGEDEEPESQNPG